MTRGIRVEIAAIILLFILGVMSQMKVWKIVKKRREERAAEQLQKKEELERSEEALGRRIEAGNNQERSIWDAVYGDRAKLKGSNIDSGIGTEAPSTIGKSSMSTGDAREVYDAGMEMQNLEGSRFDQERGGRITVHVAQDDDVPEAAKHVPRSSMDSSIQASREPSIEEPNNNRGANSVASAAASTKSKAATAIDPGLTLKPKSKVPKIVPLPFTIPDDGTRHSQKSSDASSVATFAASEHLPEQPKRSSRPLSGSELMRKLSGRLQKDAVISNVSQEALVIPHVEDDQSSIAATVDGISNHGDTEPTLSASRDPSPEKATSSSDNVMIAPQDLALPLSPREPLDVSMEAQNDGYFPAKAPNPIESEPRNALDTANETKEKVSQAPSEDPLPLARQSSLIAGNLPGGGASKVVNAYRTNEWAKYLDKADAPSIEDLKVQKTRAVEGEKAAPVDIQALSQTAIPADPARNFSRNLGDKAQLPSSRSKARSAVKPNNPYRTQPSPRTSRANSSGSPTGTVIEGAASQTLFASSASSVAAPPLPKTRSTTTPLTSPRAFRTSSSPMIGTPLTESPIEEGVETSFPMSRFTPSSAHLMSQRESILRSKPASTSLLRTGSGTSLTHFSSASNAPGGSSIGLNALDEDDNISLSQRKSILQQEQALSRNSSGTTTPYTASRTSLNPNNPYSQTVRLSTSSNLQLNTNPPHTTRPPTGTTSSAITLNTWRASLAQLPTTSSSPIPPQQQQELDLRRRELLAEKNAVRHSRAMDERSREQRESVLGREMRRGSMMDAHREAMRRMQAGVNESLRGTGT